MQSKLEINKEISADRLKLYISGRVDANGAQHLTAYMEEAVRAGHYVIQLDLTQVDYMSSAGIRVLVQYYKGLAKLGGALTVADASANVADVLEMVGMGALLSEGEPPTTVAQDGDITKILDGSWEYSISELEPHASYVCSLFGEPGLMQNSSFSEKNCRRLSFGVGNYGLGLGALGHDYADCRSRFGEFLAVNGAVAYMPGDGSRKVDYALQAGQYIPEVETLYGINLTGAPRYRIGFKSADSGKSITLSTLMQQMAQISDQAGYTSSMVVMIAETSGLVGAALSSSPFISNVNHSPFTFPQVRDYVYLTTEKIHAGTLALLAGIISREPPPELQPFIRPIKSNSDVQAHFHCAVFPYRPLKKQVLNMEEVAALLFESGQIQDLMHLLNDERETIGAGESEFIQGTCWLGGISTIKSEK